ncbi:hypothetical protein [Bordetella flabilis]|uniref:Uncharacterized protein n=1 Tax=Bordetella flabilis TaxID=463014 RepID=A0A193GJ06_9BORD|nr:hypothetical protein [Bordetella flabilis]ANN79401.1 hypothetical protein BAU07_21785 [Bordetella flabilis]
MIPSSTWPGWTWLIVAVIVLSILQAGLHVRAEMRRRAGDRAVAARQEAVRQTGRPAQAVVLQTRDTGIRLGATTFFVIDLTLRVQGDAQLPAFDTTLRVPISPVRLGDFAEGKTIRVRIDAGTREVAVDQRTE